MEQNEIRSGIEAILIASPEPVSPAELAGVLEVEQSEVDAQIDEISRNLEQSVGGFMIERVAGGVRIATRPEFDDQLRRFFSRKRENRMSIASLETLAIVAYRQPITGPEISELRGVNSSGVLRTLLERRMIRIAGRKNVVGSPFLYRTTKDFLLHFGLERIQDLPKLEEFGEILGEQVTDELGLGDLADELLDDQQGDPSEVHSEAFPDAASATFVEDDDVPRDEVAASAVLPGDDEETVEEKTGEDHNTEGVVDDTVRRASEDPEDAIEEPSTENLEAATEER